MRNMQDLLDKLSQIEKKTAVFDVTGNQQKQLMDKAIDFTMDFVDDLPEARSFVQGEPDKQRLAIDGTTMDFERILPIYKQEVVEKGIRAASGGHMGYIPGGGLYASSVGDYLAAVTNEYAGVSFASPGAVALENAILAWFTRVFDFPDTTAGNLTSGGSIANLTAIVTARDKMGVKNGNIPQHVVYLGSQTHHCIYKGLRIAGLQDVVMRHVQLDDHGRIDTSELRSMIRRDREEGLTPFMVIASAGTTDMGVVDPLREIGNIAREEKMWYHIDAAYGGFFILTEEKKHLFDGINTADSLVIDPHKGMFIPYGLGAVLIRDRRDMLNAFHSSANYMQDATLAGEQGSPADLSPELTKHFRGLRLWIPLKLYGIEPFRNCLSEKLLLTDLIRIRLEEMGFRTGPAPDLTVTYFWYPLSNGAENAFNRKLMENIHQDGSVFLSSTTLDGKFVIRSAILSFRSKVSTVESCTRMIGSCLKQTLEEFDR